MNTQNTLFIEDPQSFNDPNPWITKAQMIPDLQNYQKNQEDRLNYQVDFPKNSSQELFKPQGGWAIFD